MKKIGIFYGSSTGTCEDLAQRIAEKMGVDKTDVHSAAQLTPEIALEYDLLILGSSTWGDGDLQDDWYDGIKVLKSAELAGKLVAIFGCGDSASYPDTYCDAMGTLYNELKDCNCTFVGTGVSTDGYDFSSSTAVADGAFVGLAIDEMNQADLTDTRIDAWTDSLKAAI